MAFLNNFMPLYNSLQTQIKNKTNEINAATRVSHRLLTKLQAAVVALTSCQAIVEICRSELAQCVDALRIEDAVAAVLQKEFDGLDAVRQEIRSKWETCVKACAILDGIILDYENRLKQCIFDRKQCNKDVAHETARYKVLETEFNALMKRKPYITCQPLLDRLGALDTQKRELLEKCKRAKEEAAVMNGSMHNQFNITTGGIDAKRTSCTNIVNKKLDDFLDPKVNIPEHATWCDDPADVGGACTRGFPGKNAQPTGAIYRTTGSVPGNYYTMCSYRGTLAEHKKAKDANQWVINTASTIMPAGNYCQSCTNCQSGGFVLRCNCRTYNMTKWVPAELNFQGCFKNVKNVNGALVCGP
jgi:hypothetical protein